MRRKMADIISLVCGYLNETRADYVLVGGVVVSIHGVMRTTGDADIIIRMDEKALQDFVRFLKMNDFLVDPEEAKAALKERSHFTADDTMSQLRLDVKGAYDEMDLRTLSRRMVFNFRGVPLRIETPEDLIAAKLRYGSAQDIMDAEGIYRIQDGKLDLEYLEEACRSAGVHAKLKTMVKRLERERRSPG